LVLEPQKGRFPDGQKQQSENEKSLDFYRCSIIATLTQQKPWDMQMAATPGISRVSQEKIVQRVG
jgi:hypothetical protein